MNDTPQAQPAIAHFQDCIAKLAAANDGVKSVGAGLKSLVALLDLINSPSPEISDQLRLQLSASALRISRRILIESHTATKLTHAQLRGLAALTLVDHGDDEPPQTQAGSAAGSAASEQGEVTRHG